MISKKNFMRFRDETNRTIRWCKPLYTRLGRYRIKILRMTQLELAELLGWSERNVQHYENDRPMSLRVASRVARLLGCQVSDIWVLQDFKTLGYRYGRSKRMAARRKAELESYGYAKVGHKIVE